MGFQKSSYFDNVWGTSVFFFHPVVLVLVRGAKGMFFQKYFVVKEKSAVKKSFSTYVWNKVNLCFCEAL